MYLFIHSLYMNMEIGLVLFFLLNVWKNMAAMISLLPLNYTHSLHGYIERIVSVFGCLCVVYVKEFHAHYVTFYGFVFV